MSGPPPTPPAGPPEPTLSPIAKWALLVVLLIASLVGSYWLKLFPDAVGFSGAGAAIAGIFSFASADLESATQPPKLPTGTTFVIITLASGIYGALGAFEGNTFAVLSAFLVWFLLVVEYVLTTFRSQLDNYVPQTWDSWIVAILGLIVVGGEFLVANPTAGFVGLLITLAVAIPSYINTSSSAPTAGKPAAVVLRLQQFPGQPPG